MLYSFTLPTDERTLLDVVGGELLAGSGFEAEEPDPTFVAIDIPEFLGGDAQ